MNDQYYIAFWDDTSESYTLIPYIDGARAVIALEEFKKHLFEADTIVANPCTLDEALGWIKCHDRRYG